MATRLKLLKKQAKLDEYVAEVRNLYQMSVDIEKERKNFLERYESLENTLGLLNATLDETQLLKMEINPDFVPDFSISDEIDGMTCHIKSVKSILTNPSKEDKEEKVAKPSRESTDSPQNEVAIIPSTECIPVILEGGFVKNFKSKRQLANYYLSQMLDCKPVTEESPEQLDKLLCHFNFPHMGLKELGIPDVADYIILYIALTKLDDVTAREFVLSETVRKKKFPTVSDLLSFLQHKVNVLEMLKMFSGASICHESEEFGGCSLCGLDMHPLYYCKSFLALEPEERYKFVKREKRCCNCLSSIHRFPQCKSTTRCKTCSKNHHTLLHSESIKRKPSQG